MSHLPAKPDFAAIEAAAPKGTGRRMVTLTLIGNLVHCWSNNESLFIYILMLLLETDEASAAVVFGTLNTTRARIDLIERLAKLKIKDKAVEKKLDDIVERFNDTTRLRNEFNHCMYVVDEHGEITHTNNMRVQEVRGQLQLGVVRPMDDERLRELQESIRAMTGLNRDIWNFMAVLQAHLANRPQDNQARKVETGAAR
jgi:Asp-tRNA(Asn)/Glu-tRNA(Gln) amidotransferase C subunit